MTIKRQNKEFRKACFGMPPKIGRCPTKIGTHPHKQKKFQNMAVDVSRCCRGVVTACKQTSNKMANKNDTALKGKKGTLNGAFHYDSLTKNSYTTARQLVKLDNVTQVQLQEPVDFTQAIMFNTTTVLYITRQVHHQRVGFIQTRSIDNFASRQGAPTPYLQQPTTTFLRPRHTCVYSTHFTKVSRR